MNFTPIYLAVKQATGNKQDPFPIYAILAGTVGKMKFISSSPIKVSQC